MNDLLLTAFATVVGSGAVAAVVSGMFGRRKNTAETTEIVNRVAGEQLTRMQAEIGRLETKVRDLGSHNDELERKVDRLERREMQHRDLLQTHAVWDWRVSEALRSRLTPEELEALDIKPAPPLYPPT